MSSTSRTTSNIYLGLDVHKDSITVAVCRRAGPPESVERYPNDLAKLRRVFDRLGKDKKVRACYEAGWAGFALQREISAWGHHCDVIAPSLIPQRPGLQRKHDKRDAVDLARLYRASELTVIRVPDESEERVRDLLRCRGTLQHEVLKSRHYILKFLGRRGLVFRAAKNWSQAHYSWLRRLAAANSPLKGEDAIVFSEYLALLEYKVSRRDEMDRRIQILAMSPEYAPGVALLMCFRGIQVHTAMVLLTEIGDWRRFKSPRQLMAFLGLVPRERSSGDRERRGSITKAGNAHCRHVLVQAAWSYRHQPRLSTSLKARQQGRPALVISHAWKAQLRLHRLYKRLAFRSKSQIAVVAAARELVGFLWAVMQETGHATAAAHN
jgi:transposase